MNSSKLPFMIEAVVLDPSQELMMRFLVGEVTDVERDAVEQRFGDDSQYFEELCALEHEMLLALVRHQLPNRWAQPFAAAVHGSPDRRRRLEEVRELAEALGMQGAPAVAVRANVARTPWLQVAALLALSVGLTGWWWLGRLPSGSTATEQPPSVSPVEESTVTLLLEPGPTRSSAEEENVVRIQPGTARLLLTAQLDGVPVAVVHARIKPVGAAELDVPSAATVRDAGPGFEVSWAVPAVALAPGDYLITYYDETVPAPPRPIGSRFLRVVQ